MSVWIETMKSYRRRYPVPSVKGGSNMSLILSWYRALIEWDQVSVTLHRVTGSLTGVSSPTGSPTEIKSVRTE